MKWPWVFLIPAGFAGPALACDDGPGILEFAGTSARLTYEGRETLKLMARPIRDGMDNDDILVVFHDPRPTRASAALRNERSRTIRRYLGNLNIAQARIRVVATSKPAPVLRFDGPNGMPPRLLRGNVTVEFSRGCGG